MRALWIGLATVVAGGVVVAGGCNPAPVTVASERLVPEPLGDITRIAVLPFTTAEGVGEALTEPGQPPFVEPPAVTVRRAVTDAMRRLPRWQVADELTVGEAFRRLYGAERPPTPEEARAVGTLLGVDAVLRGQVTTFEERVGADFAAKQPAWVIFGVELLRIPSGQVVWQAEYAERQQALTENLWNLFGFLRAGARWLRAAELAALGAEQVAARMYAGLYGAAATPARETERPRPQAGPGTRR
jgi:hypothetical protein